jgi:hypothetical protein
LQREADYCIAALGAVAFAPSMQAPVSTSA